MDGPSTSMDEEKFSDSAMNCTVVTALQRLQRDRTETTETHLPVANEQAVNRDRNTEELCDLYSSQIEEFSRNGEICDANRSGDPREKLLDKRKCACNDDSAFLSDLRPACGDANKAGCITIGEDECRICQSRGEEALISPCKCAGSAKWVHESCLIKWFQVSQTSSCELCSRHVAIKKHTKPLQQWRIPKEGLGPCSRVDLWYLFVTVFSLCTIVGFGIFQLLVKSKEPETTAVFAAIYALCGVMILLRVHYFYVWFTRRSVFWRKWKTINRVWTVASPGAILKVDEVATIV